MKKTLTGSVSHTEETIKELGADRQFSVRHLKAALGDLDDPDNPAACKLVLRDVAEAYGGLEMVGNPGARANPRHIPPHQPTWTT